ncbi:MAG: flagellar basal body rod protein FlgC [Candidatus Gastranaerophilaceae bacterium]
MTILNSMDVGAKAVGVHGTRMNIIAKNVANLDTPNYVRKIPVLNSTDDVSFAGLLNVMKDDMFANGNVPFTSGSVALSGVVEDPTLGDRLYRPGHPDADANGYIRASNVNPLVEFGDASMAQRAYEASLAVVKISKSMADRAVELGNG